MKRTCIESFRFAKLTKQKTVPESGRLWMNSVMWVSKSARSLNGRRDHTAADISGHFSTKLPNILTKSSYVREFTALMSMAWSCPLQTVDWCTLQKPILNEVNVRRSKTFKLFLKIIQASFLIKKCRNVERKLSKGNWFEQTSLRYVPLSMLVRYRLEMINAIKLRKM